MIRREPNFSETPFDWQQVKQRLKAAQIALRRADQLTDEQVNLLMEERAQQLARVPTPLPDRSELVEVVRFRIGKERFGVETRFVVEHLVRPPGITKIPGTDECFLGVTNLRGQITTVVDFGKYLGIASEATCDSPLLVLGRSGNREFGILVDELDDVKNIHKKQIHEPGSGLTNILDLLIGCTSDALLILDGEAMLECERLFIDQNEP